MTQYTDTPKRDKRLLIKLDICLITRAWFAYLIKVSLT